MYINPWFFQYFVQIKTSKKISKKSSKKPEKINKKTAWKCLGMGQDCSGTVPARLQRPRAMPGQCPGHPEVLTELLLAL